MSSIRFGYMVWGASRLSPVPLTIRDLLSIVWSDMRDGPLMTRAV